MTAPANTNRVFYTVDELAERWRCTRRSIVDKIKNGEMAAFKLGKRRYRITVAEVERIETSQASARAAQ